ncbi:MAG: betaine/proline/choline family ABC transporter ATP-binding protein [Flaviflexus sp.]|nr:betaine/proline/choline family ABC transporter ATP-binding protein [Flaviflexus sp.]
MKALRCENVYKVFGRDAQQATKKLQQGGSLDDVSDNVTVAVNDVSFEVEEGEIFVVMGLSGSGKSTLLRTLNALGPATGGKIFVGEHDITSMKPDEIRKIRAEYMSMVFQHFALLPHRTVIENAAYPLEIQGVAKEERLERAREALETTGLKGWDDNYPSELSGGMQQRVGLARALCADAKILLMDEAFSALDPLIRQDMQELLLEIQAEKKQTIIFITHDLNEAMFLGNRIAVMRSGSIDQIGTAEEIITQPANDYISRFVQGVDRSRVITAGAIKKKPLVRIYLSDGPHVALRKMEQEDLPGGWVIRDGSRRLVGPIFADWILDALKKNPQLDSIAGLIGEHYQTVTEDTPLADVVPSSAEGSLAVPIVDEGHHLVGVVPRVTLLKALAAAGEDVLSDEEEAPDPALAAPTAPGAADAGAPAGKHAAQPDEAAPRVAGDEMKEEDR